MIGFNRMVALVRQLFRFAKASGKWWLLPLVLFLVLFAGMLIVAEQSALAPFIYAIF